jgi:hypothetical protein
VTQDILLVLLTGGLTLLGTFGGAFFTAKLSRMAERDRREAEDARRWQGDRRALYAKYLHTTSVMLRDISLLREHLPQNNNRSISAADEERIDEDLSKFLRRWHQDIWPAAGEIELLASSEVADLAAGVSGELMDLYVLFQLVMHGESGSTFGEPTVDNFVATWRRIADLRSDLRAAMRRELGVHGQLERPEGDL